MCKAPSHCTFESTLHNCINGDDDCDFGKVLSQCMSLNNASIPSSWEPVVIQLLTLGAQSCVQSHGTAKHEANVSTLLTCARSVDRLLAESQTSEKATAAHSSTTQPQQTEPGGSGSDAAALLPSYELPKASNLSSVRVECATQTVDQDTVVSRTAAAAFEAHAASSALAASAARLLTTFESSLHRSTMEIEEDPRGGAYLLPVAHRPVPHGRALRQLLPREWKTAPRAALDDATHSVDSTILGPSAQCACDTTHGGVVDPPCQWRGRSRPQPPLLIPALRSFPVPSDRTAEFHYRELEALDHSFSRHNDYCSSESHSDVQPWLNLPCGLLPPPDGLSRQKSLVLQRLNTNSARKFKALVTAVTHSAPHLPSGVQTPGVDPSRPLALADSLAGRRLKSIIEDQRRRGTVLGAINTKTPVPTRLSSSLDSTPPRHPGSAPRRKSATDVPTSSLHATPRGPPNQRRKSADAAISTSSGVLTRRVSSRTRGLAPVPLCLDTRGLAPVPLCLDTRGLAPVPLCLDGTDSHRKNSVAFSEEVPSPREKRIETAEVGDELCLSDDEDQHFCPTDGLDGALPRSSRDPFAAAAAASGDSNRSLPPALNPDLLESAS